MNWYRIKTVLIFLFLAINIFLLTLLGAESLSKTRAAKEKGEAAGAALAQNGISVEVPVPYKTPKLGTLTLENPKAEPETLAERILGGRAVQVGDAWRREGKILVLQERGFRYDSGMEAVIPEKKDVSRLREELSNMGFSMEYAKGYREGEAVVFVQMPDGVQLFESALSVYPTADGTIARMEGVWANITKKNYERRAIKPAADALLAFLRSGERGKITAITCGYAVLRAEDGYRTADAIPVWKVETADGAVFYEDARQ